MYLFYLFFIFTVKYIFNSIATLLATATDDTIL